MRRFRADFREFRRLEGAQGDGATCPPVTWSERMPMLFDRTSTTTFDRHYVFHTAWAARILARTRPARHVDVASSVYFSALVSAFVPIEFYDLRPAEMNLSQLTTGHADLTRLPFPDASLPSLSCMHAVEHVGLGRYGDPLDPGGDRKAMAELARVVAPGGSLLFVVPTGRPVVRFNAHRIYAYRHVLEAFPGFTLASFALVTDGSAGVLVEDAPESLADAQKYGCGCYWFRRS